MKIKVRIRQVWTNGILVEIISKIKDDDVYSISKEGVEGLLDTIDPDGTMDTDPNWTVKEAPKMVVGQIWDHPNRNSPCLITEIKSKEAYYTSPNGPKPNYNTNGELCSIDDEGFPNLVYGWVLVSQAIAISNNVTSSIAVNDHVCPHCKNNRCSKTEKTCWKCGGKL